VVQLRRASAPRFTWLGLLGLAVLFLPALAGAGPPSDELRGFFTAANAILAAAEGREADDVVDTIVVLARPMVAFREAAELALGTEWRARTRVEQDEFVRLFADLLERAFVRRLAGAARARTGIEMRFGDEVVTGRFASVQAALTGKDGNEIPLEYRMIRRGSGWAVRDLTLHGVSVVANYQAQFSRIIRDGSYSELVARLREKATATASASPIVLPSPVEHVASSPPVPRLAAVLGVAPDPRTEPAAVDARARQPTPRLVGVASDPPTHPASVGVAPTPRVASAVRYWVQTGAFQDIDAVGRLVARLLGEQLPVGLAPGTSLTRVRVGPFVSREEALRHVRALARRGYQPFIAEER
jgi:ABC-type transporter MlaC component